MTLWIQGLFSLTSVPVYSVIKSNIYEKSGSYLKMGSYLCNVTDDRFIL